MAGAYRGSDVQLAYYVMLKWTRVAASETHELCLDHHVHDSRTHHSGATPSPSISLQPHIFVSSSLRRPHSSPKQHGPTVFSDHRQARRRHCVAP